MQVFLSVSLFYVLSVLDQTSNLSVSLIYFFYIMILVVVHVLFLREQNDNVVLFQVAH